MKHALKRNIFTSFLLATICCGIFLFSLTSCSSSNKIRFGNFESYMSHDLMDQLHDQYNIEFMYYSTNEDIETKFPNYYDIAVPSTYEVVTLYQKDQLATIP